jgi:hypothetical protein
MKRLLLTLAVFAVPTLFLIPAAYPGADAGDALPAVDEVLERYVEAVGGRAAIESLTTRVCIGRMVHDLSWKTPVHEVIPFTAYGAVPGRVLVVEHKPDGTRCEGSDGEVTWVQDAKGVTLKDEPFQSKVAWLFDPQGVARLTDYFPDLEITSEKVVDGRSVYVVESSELDPTHYALSFDAETGLLVGIGYYWSLQDYRVVDGVKIPHRVAMSRKGGSTTFIFDLVGHNLPLEESLFQVPTSLDQTDR